MCTIILMNNNFITKYHSKTNSQVDRYSRTIPVALRIYIDNHPRDRELYADALTYVQNCREHTPTSVAPSELVISKQPRPIALKPMPSREEAKGDFKRK